MPTKVVINYLRLVDERGVDTSNSSSKQTNSMIREVVDHQNSLLLVSRLQIESMTMELHRLGQSSALSSALPDYLVLHKLSVLVRAEMSAFDENPESE